jgi:hypothetical protein
MARSSSSRFTAVTVNSSILRAIDFVGNAQVGVALL